MCQSEEIDLRVLQVFSSCDDNVTSRVLAMISIKTPVLALKRKTNSGSDAEMGALVNPLGTFSWGTLHGRWVRLNHKN